MSTESWSIREPRRPWVARVLTFDWNAARTAIFGAPGRANLSPPAASLPTNVREAIATLQPWGVDVASGVEAAPGRKDPAKVRDFVASARTAGNLAELLQ